MSKTQTLEEALAAEFDAWFLALQALSPIALDPEDWTGRWYDDYTPAEALEDGPEDDDE